VLLVLLIRRCGGRRVAVVASPSEMAAAWVIAMGPVVLPSLCLPATGPSLLASSLELAVSRSAKDGAPENTRTPPLRPGAGFSYRSRVVPRTAQLSEGSPELIRQGG
jgi:hypothetical protein